MHTINKPEILIAGSSWARGEWDPDKPVVLHPGIKQYFADDGYAVIDATQARSYHSRVLSLLEKRLSEHSDKNKVVFFIMADPLLDIIMPELEILRIKRSIDVKHLPDFTNRIKEANGLINLLRNTQDNIYNRLNEIAKKYNVIVHCIGGTYNINTNLLKNYTNLLPTVVSWIHLLVGHYKEHQFTSDPEFGITYTWGIEYIDLSQYTPEFSDRVQEEFVSISDSTRIMDELIFHPDGLHPNREGHKILYNHLVNLLHL